MHKQWVTLMLAATVALVGCRNTPSDGDDASTGTSTNGTNGEPAAPKSTGDAGSDGDKDHQHEDTDSGVTGSAAKDGDDAAAEADEYGLTVGDAAPNVTLRTPNDAPFDLADAYSARPAMVIFYRGGWCPYCNQHLKDVAEVQNQLRDAGLQVIAISPDRPLELKKTLRKHDLPYQLLSDSDMQAAEAFEVAFEVDASTLTQYKEYGIDLEEASGRDHHKLPVPSVYIIDTEGVIRFAHSDPDYKVRLSQKELLAAAEAAR